MRPFCCEAARALNWFTEGAGDMLQRPTSAPLKGPVCVALRPCSFIREAWSAGLVASGESLLRSNSRCAATVPAWKKRKVDLRVGEAGRAKFQTFREMVPVKLP